MPKNRSDRLELVLVLVLGCLRAMDRWLLPSRQADITRLHMHTTVFESSCEGFTSLRAGRFSRPFSTANPENILSERVPHGDAIGTMWIQERVYWLQLIGTLPW